MLVRIVLWNLADSKTTIEELRRYLRNESVEHFAEVPGLRFKAWISDEATERWGAIYLWESAEAAQHELPSRARESALEAANSSIASPSVSGSETIPRSRRSSADRW